MSPRPSLLSTSRKELTINIGVLNVGGIEGKIESALHIAITTRLDFVGFTEVKSRDCSAANYINASGLGHHAVTCNHPSNQPHVRGTNASGDRVYGCRGVLAVCLNSDLKMIELARDEKAGVLLVQLSARRHDGFSPVLVCVVYIPDAGAERKERTGPAPKPNASLMAVARMLQRFGKNNPRHFFVMGDFNMRYGPTPEHCTQDPGSRVSGRQSILRDFCACNDLLPLHGRTIQGGQSVAEVTSRNPAASGLLSPGPPDSADPFFNFSEVDYVLGSSNTLPHKTLSIEGGSWLAHAWPSTHTMLAVSLLVPVNDPVARATTKAKRRPHPVGPYGDPSWRTFSAASSAELLDLATDMRATPSMAALDIYTRLAKVLLHAAEAARPMIRDAYDGLPNATRAAAQRPRGIDQAPRPREVVEALNAARAAREAWRAAARAPHSAHSVQLATQLQRDSRAADLRVKLTEKAHHRRYLTALSSEMARLKSRDQTRYYELLNDFQIGRGPAAGIPDDPLHEPAAARFPAALRDLMKGGRTRPVALVDPSSMSYVPQAPMQPSERLANHITPEEVFHRVFHPSKRVVPTACSKDCQSCALYRADWNRWDGRVDCDFPAPKASPNLNTSTAGGTDGVLAEFLKWPRGANLDQTHTYKLIMCEILAGLCNAVLVSGEMPAPLLQYKSVSLFKGKPGLTMDACDPDCYRFLTLGSTISKVFDLVMTHRISHWSTNNNLISGVQVGFMTRHSAEEHVWTLMEAVKARWRGGMDTYALFVDFRKAYDMVHHDALTAVLRHMNMPERLVKVLEHRWRTRTTSITVNGVESDPIPQREGVGQGDVMSPILFNLFIESLFRELLSSPDFHGITFGKGGTVSDEARPARPPPLNGIELVAADAAEAANCERLVLRALGYADDVAVPCSSTEQVQTAATCVADWARRWGMDLSMGQDKTMAIRFPANSALSSALPEMAITVKIGNKNVVVPWAHSYRYLGLPITPDLNMEAYVDKLIAKAKLNWLRFFRRTSLLHHAPPAALLELFKVAVLPNYLLALLESEKLEKAMDAAGRLAAEWSVGCTSSAPRSVVSATTGLWDFRSVMVRERTRLFLQLTASPFPNSIASRLASLLAGAIQPRGTTDPRQSWLRRTTRMFDRINASYKIAPPNTINHSAGFTASVFARALANTVWMSKAITHCLTKEYYTPVMQSVCALPSGKPVMVAASLHDGYSRDGSVLGGVKGITPSSAVGPGCSAYMASLVSNPAISSILIKKVTLLHLGREGLFRFPLAPEHRRFPLSSAASEGSYSDIVRKWYDLAHGTTCCSATGCTSATILDPVHVFFDCTAPSVVSARALLREKLPYIASRIVATCYEVADVAAGRTSIKDIAYSRAKSLAFDTLLYDMDWSSADGRWTTFRLLLCTTWGAHSVAETPAGVSCAVAHAMGEAFDDVGVHHHRLRSMANMWVSWASRTVHRIVGAWKLAEEDAESALAEEGGLLSS